MLSILLEEFLPDKYLRYGAVIETYKMFGVCVEWGEGRRGKGRGVGERGSNPSALLHNGPNDQKISKASTEGYSAEMRQKTSPWVSSIKCNVRSDCSSLAYQRGWAERQTSSFAESEAYNPEAYNSFAKLGFFTEPIKIYFPIWNY